MSAEDRTTKVRGSEGKGSLATSSSDRLRLKKSVFTLEERKDQIRKLLQGLDLDQEGKDGEDMLGLEGVLDRWAQVLMETLPPTPWTAVYSINLGDKARQGLIVDVTKHDFEELTVEGQIIGEVHPNGEICAVHTPKVKDSGNMVHDVPMEDLQIFPVEGYYVEKLEKWNAILDHLAFFKNHLWFSFDEGTDEDEELDVRDREYLVEKYGVDSAVLKYYDTKATQALSPRGGLWHEKCLENRIQILKSHVANENGIYRQLRYLSDEYNSLKTDLYEDAEPLLFGTGKPELIAECLDIRRKMRDVRVKVENLQNSEMRNAVEVLRMDRKRREREASRKGRFTSYVTLVWDDNCGNFDDMVEAMNNAKLIVGFDGDSTVLEIKPSFQASLDDALPGDTIVIPRGTHRMTNWGAFRNGGTIFGFDPQESIIEVNTCNWPSKDLSSGYAIIVEKSVTFQNLLIKPEETRESKGILVKSGSVMMKNCQVNEFDVTTRIMPGASLVLETVSFSIGRVGLIVDEGASVEANVFDVFGHSYPFVFKDPSGQKLSFNHVGTDYASNHTTVVIDGDNANAADLLKEAVMTDCEDLKEDVNAGIRTVKIFDENA